MEKLKLESVLETSNIRKFEKKRKYEAMQDLKGNFCLQ